MGNPWTLAAILLTCSQPFVPPLSMVVYHLSWLVCCCLLKCFNLGNHRTSLAKEVVSHWCLLHHSSRGSSPKIVITTPSSFLMLLKHISLYIFLKNCNDPCLSLFCTIPKGTYIYFSHFLIHLFHSLLFYQIPYKVIKYLFKFITTRDLKVCFG